MSRFSRRSALGALTGAVAGLAGCSALGVSNPFGGSVTADGVSISAAEPWVNDPIAGIPWQIHATFTNPGGRRARREVPVEVDGEVVETWTVALEGNETTERSLEHTLEGTGEHEVSVLDATDTITLTEEADLWTSYRAAGQYAVGPDRQAGVAKALLVVENESELRVPFDPDVRVDGEPIGQLHYRARDGVGEPFDGQLGPHDAAALVGWREVEVGSDYEVTVDGESIGTASLEPESVPTRHGGADRAGPSVPRRGVGREPEIVDRFAVERPDGVEEADPERMETVAVTEDRIYLRFRWGNQYHSLAAYERWGGEEHWHRSADNPADLAVFDGTEYLLDGGTLTARAVGGGEEWRRTVNDEPYGNDGSRVIPTDDRLYVGTPDGVDVFDRSSGDRQAALGGTRSVVGDDAVFTWDTGAVRRYEPGSEEPEWVTELDRKPGDEDVRVGEPHEFTQHAVATGDAVVVLSHVRDGYDTRYLAHCYEAATGAVRWTRTVAETVPWGNPVVGASGAVTSNGDRMYVLPDVTQPVVHRGRLYVGSPTGCYGYDLETGETGPPYSFETRGTYPTIADVDLAYFARRDGVYTPSRSATLGGASDEEPTPTVSLPEETAFETHTATHLFGRDVLYLLWGGYVYAIGGTVPGNSGDGDAGGDAGAEE